MAATITAALLSADKHCIKYKLTSSGAGTLSLKAHAGTTPDMATDTPTGALHTWMVTARADQAAARAAWEDVSIMASVVNRVAAVDYLVVPNVTGTEFQLDLTCAAADAGGSILTIWLRKSPGKS